MRQPTWLARLTDVRLCRNQCVSTGPVDDGQRRSAGLDQINPDDVATLREVQRLSQDEGINLAGIKRILDLESEVERLREQAAPSRPGDQYRGARLWRPDRRGLTGPSL